MKVISQHLPIAHSLFGWVGNERLAFKVVEEKGKRVLSPIPDVPKRGETTISKPIRGSLVPAVNLNYKGL